MWRASMLLLCLIAALSGTLLRQAEAAGDFARAQAEHGKGRVDGIDGGVGDDAELAVRNAGDDTPSLRAMIPPVAEDFLAPPLPTALSMPGFGHRRPFDRAAPFSSGSLPRYVWLRCFLF